jgi:tetratricopeptide (TPR) repeat protein
MGLFSRLLPVMVLALAGCSEPLPTVGGKVVGDSGEVGVDSIRAVRLFENHSTALIEWRRAGVRDRVLVHLDGHADLDWLPDITVARIAAARPDELPALELHPYTMDGTALGRFGIWNFIYPAARMGIVRELVWVVPDGSLGDPESVVRLARDILVGKLEMVSVKEALGLQAVGRAIQGEILGVPILVCEIGDLPVIHEPVLLDVDLDYFTTGSAVSQSVTAGPWISPRAVIDVLQKKQIRTDLVTLSYSTIGGFLPPGSRWIGPTMVRELRKPRAELPAGDRARMEAQEAMEAGDAGLAVELYGQWTRVEPDSACAWFSYARALEEAGRMDEAVVAGRQAVARDPILAHEALFQADRLWFNRSYGPALAEYERYLERLPVGPFTAYALRRQGGCLRRLNRDAEAEAVYRRMLELAPDHGDTLLDLGILLREKGDVEEAMALLRKARELLPDRSDYARALGTTHLLSGDIRSAVTELTAAVERKPSSVIIRRNLAIALIQDSRPVEAATQIRIALALDPGNPAIRQIAAQLQRAGLAL